MGAVNLAGLQSSIMDSKAALPAGWLDAFAQAHLPIVPEMDARVSPGRGLAAPVSSASTGGAGGAQLSGCPYLSAPCCVPRPATPRPGAGCRARRQRRGPARGAAAAARGLPRRARAAGARACGLAAAARRAQRVTGGRGRADAVPPRLHLLHPPALPPGPAAGRSEQGAAALWHLPSNPNLAITWGSNA